MTVSLEMFPDLEEGKTISRNRLLEQDPVLRAKKINLVLGSAV